MSERHLDFDTVIDRKGTRSLKYDFAVRRGKPKDVLPLWVADMDFQTSSYITDGGYGKAWGIRLQRVRGTLFWGCAELDGETL